MIKMFNATLNNILAVSLQIFLSFGGKQEYQERMEF